MRRQRTTGRSREKQNKIRTREIRAMIQICWCWSANSFELACERLQFPENWPIPLGTRILDCTLTRRSIRSTELTRWSIWWPDDVFRYGPAIFG